MSNRLVLFDIDGTLLKGGPLWRESFFRGASRFVSDWEKALASGLTFGGKTDYQICRELWAAAGQEGYSDEHGAAMIEAYLSEAEKLLIERSHEIEVLPGVLELIEALDHLPDVKLGLLTGNVRAGAEMKLGAVGLWPRFEMGAWGDDAEKRVELPPIAVERAAKKFGEVYQGKDIVIVGDTVHDVMCGRPLGVRSIAVGTGAAAKEQLLESRPDYFFENLSETDSVVGAILEQKD